MGSKSFPGRGGADSAADTELLEHEGLGAKHGERKGWWSVSVPMWVQEERDVGPLRSWRGLAGGPRADRGKGGIGRYSQGQPDLFPTPGLNFPVRAIFEKLIFNDTSKP